MPGPISPAQVCAVILAGGRGSRMGGVDKGLQVLAGRALIDHAIDRLMRQNPDPPAIVAINANRFAGQYAERKLPVWPDARGDYAGPLAGFQSGLQRIQLDWPECSHMLTVPCDSPLFPLDLLSRMAQALQGQAGGIAVAVAPEFDNAGLRRLRRQPVFSLVNVSLGPALDNFLAQGGRKIDSWMAMHRCVEVAFDRPHDDPDAFANVNTLEQLHQMGRP
jgi:molybdopterin-guanine dinucleotide biosynthesis protein A